MAKKHLEALSDLGPSIWGPQGLPQIISRKGIARYGGGISHWAAKGVAKLTVSLTNEIHVPFVLFGAGEVGGLLDLHPRPV